MSDEQAKSGDNKSQHEPPVSGNGKGIAKVNEKNGVSARATVLLSIATALLTSFLAPFLLERWKDADLARQVEKEKQDRIVATQFEIVEKYNEMFWHYRQAAGFLMFDFTHGQSDELLKRHRKEFEDISAEANREMPTQAFRARMYFNSIYVNNKLFGIWAGIFNGVDDEISRQLLKDKAIIHLDDRDSQDAWLKISSEINDSMITSETSLNEVYQLIGQSNIDATVRPGNKLTLYRLGDELPQLPNSR